MNIIFYQLKKEKNGTAQFSIDIDEMMSLINASIRDNKTKYEADYTLYPVWLERMKKYAMEKYGLTLG